MAPPIGAPFLFCWTGKDAASKDGLRSRQLSIPLKEQESANVQQDIPNQIACPECVPEVLPVRRFVLDQDPTAGTHKTAQTAKCGKPNHAWHRMQGSINTYVFDPMTK